MKVTIGFQDAFKAISLKVMDKVNTAKNMANAETAIRIVETSPIRSGKFRANWNASLNTPDLTTSSNVNYNPGGIKNIAMSASLHDVFYLSDGLPYGHRLEFEGWSNQAPSGMVRINLKQYRSVLQEAINKVGAAGV